MKDSIVKYTDSELYFLSIKKKIKLLDQFI
jgi:hypothetical protein